MAKSASASPPTSVSMWPASARSARLPVKSAPSTSTTRNAAVSPSVVRSRGRERAAAVGRGACAMTRIVAGFLLQSGIHHDRSLVLHGQRFHFLDWGAPTAPAVVLLHGITGHARAWDDRSEEHTSELQSQSNLVCRLLLEKKKTTHTGTHARS